MECNDYTDKAIAISYSYYNMTRYPLRPTKVFVISSVKVFRTSSLRSVNITKPLIDCHLSVGGQI
jgi:hypothetical protein